MEDGRTAAGTSVRRWAAAAVAALSRTLDRTIVGVPDGEIASVSLEAFSVHDKYWMHHQVRLGADTTPPQLQAVLERIRGLLSSHPAVDPASVRVRFIRPGPCSFDIEVFAYLVADDWSQFLENQDALLLAVTDTVRASGVSLALPPHMLDISESVPGHGEAGAAGMR